MRLAILALLAGCGDSTATPDAGVVRTSRFTPQLCTSGTAGDPTCPTNNVDLSTVVPDTSFEFVMRVGNADVTLTGVVSTSATSLGKMTLEVWCADCTTPMSHVLATDVRNGSTGITATTFNFGPSEQVSILFDRVVR